MYTKAMVIVMFACGVLLGALAAYAQYATQYLC